MLFCSQSPSMSSSSSGYSRFQHQVSQASQIFSIASLQSSTRPGAVLELDPISDAVQVGGVLIQIIFFKE